VFHRIDGCSGAFVRSITGLDHVDQAKMKASFRDGRSNRHLPKSAEHKSRSTEAMIQ
jgi:hypothetical protein